MHWHSILKFRNCQIIKIHLKKKNHHQSFLNFLIHFFVIIDYVWLIIIKGIKIKKIP